MVAKKKGPAKRETGVFFVHWESVDIDPVHGPQSRMFKQVGMTTLPQPESIRFNFTRQPHRWKIQVRVKLPDNSIEMVEFLVKEPVYIKDLDSFMLPYMIDLYKTFPDAIDRGWKAQVVWGI